MLVMTVGIPIIYRADAPPGKLLCWCSSLRGPLRTNGMLDGLPHIVLVPLPIALLVAILLGEDHLDE